MSNWGTLREEGKRHWSLLVMFGPFYEGASIIHRGWTEDYFTKEAAVAAVERYREEGVDITVKCKAKRQPACAGKGASKAALRP